MRYTKYSLAQYNKRDFISDWAYKEGVFSTPQGDYIVRISTAAPICSKPVRDIQTMKKPRRHT